MAAGLKTVIPATFTDTTLPPDIHPTGISAGLLYRYVSKLLPLQQSLTEGADVAAWPSIGSNTASLTPAANSSSGCDAPLYRVNSGNPYVEFDGVDDGMGIAGYTDDTVKTSVLVMRHNYSSGSGLIISGSRTNLSTNGFLILQDNSGGVPTRSISPNVWHIVAIAGTLNAAALTVDGVESTQTPVGSTARMATYNLGRAASSYGRFDLAEVLAFSDAKSDADLATIRTALKAAYPGLSLP